MTVALDAVTSDSASGSTSVTGTHTPTGTPRAVIILVASPAAKDAVGTVTYGSLTLTEVSGSPNILSGGEGGSSFCFFAGSSIPTGAQTYTIPADNGNSTRDVIIITLTAAADTEVVDSDGTINSASQANPSITLSLSSRTSFAAIGFYSGHNSVGQITPLTDWTAQFEVDNGSQVSGFYTFDTIGSSDVTAGWTQTADDACALAIAVSEVTAGVTLPIFRNHYRMMQTR